MTRRSRAKAVDRLHAGRYRRLAQSFATSAQALSDVASDDEGYGNAIGLLVVHTCVAYADVLAISYGERKSTAGDHQMAVVLLRDILRDQLTDAAEKSLGLVIRSKDELSYQGRYYSLTEARHLLSHASSFAAWAESMYDRRPT